MPDISRRCTLTRNGLRFLLNRRQCRWNLEQSPDALVYCYDIQLLSIVAPRDTERREMPIFLAFLRWHIIHRHMRTKVSDVVDHDNTISVISVDWMFLFEEGDRAAVRGEDGVGASAVVIFDSYDLRARA